MKRELTLALLILTSFSVGCGKIEPINGGCIGTRCYKAATNRPTDLTAIAGDRSVQLSWSTVSGAENYIIYYGNSLSLTGTEANEGNSGAVQTSKTSFTLTGLTNNSEYQFAVSSVNARKESSEKSTFASAIPVAAPIPTRDAISKIQIKTCIKGTDEFVISNGKLKINHVAGGLPEVSWDCTIRGYAYQVNISVWEEGVNGVQNYYWNPTFTGNTSEYDLHIDDIVLEQEQSIVNPVTHLIFSYNRCNSGDPWNCGGYTYSVGTINRDGLKYTFDNMPNVTNQAGAGPFEVIFDYKYKVPQ